MRAVILAGGRGTRLAPYTTVLPKPLMPVGEKPILDIVIRQLRHYGFTEVTLAVGHLAELIQAYFGDGERFGIKIRYSREHQPLGTAGPLALIDDLSTPFLMMNGDILTTIDFARLMEAHRSGGQIATVCAFARPLKVDLGVIEFDGDHRLTQYLEKPTHHYWVSMGVYAFDPRICSHVSRDRPLDLPDMLKALVAAGETVRCHEHDGYWLDIGRLDDYQRAAEDFGKLRHLFLPGGDDNA
jgi:NDP-sugar pyrophosphorylase family protein